MRLAYRVLLYSFTVIVLLVVAILAIVDNRLHSSIIAETEAGLAREARYVAARWKSGDEPDQLANSAGSSLGRRVTVVDATGKVVGDSEFDPAEIHTLENHLYRPEIIDASRSGIGVSRRPSRSRGDEEMYVALPVAQKGFVRVSVSTVSVDRIFDRARREILIAGAAALLLATLVAAVFAARVSKPIVELRDAAQSLADREFDARSMSGAPGEVGDLANALSQLSSRLSALEGVRRDFVANVSHELRTPLTVIGGFAETLADPDVPEEKRKEFAAMILSSTRRMQRIVDDLLDLSRIESGGWIPKPESVDVAAAAHEAVSPLKHHLSAKGLSLRTYFPSGAQTVRGDPTAVTQIFANLSENAVRHTTSGVITVFSEADAGGVWIGVRDTGEGIRDEHLPRIFERFYRVDTSRSREDGGTGLGLAIVRHLVEAHGGRVRATSRVGEGTTIAAFFPSETSTL
ncbi:MAG TPA: ATP-binding protein [Gemmatimonadaceae bacterium]